MIGVARLPETEPIVVLGGKNDHRHAGVFCFTDPLVGIERGGLEYLWVFEAAPPLHGRECIGSEMDKAGELILLPGQLLRRRHDVPGLFDHLVRGIVLVDRFQAGGFHRMQA